MEGDAYAQPSRLKAWVDADGTSWRRAGDSPLAIAAARRLLHDQTVDVVLFYLGETKQIVSADERAALWSRMEPVMRRRPGINPHSEFLAFRFRAGDGQKLLAIEERC